MVSPPGDMPQDPSLGWSCCALATMASGFPTWSLHPVKSPLSHIVLVAEDLGCTSAHLLVIKNAPGHPILLFGTTVGCVNRMTVGPRPLLHTESGGTEPTVAESWSVSLE